MRNGTLRAEGKPSDDQKKKKNRGEAWDQGRRKHTKRKESSGGRCAIVPFKGKEKYTGTLEQWGVGGGVINAGDQNFKRRASR